MRPGREDKLNRLFQRSEEFSPKKKEPLASVSNVSIDESTNIKSMIDIVVQLKEKNIFTDVRVYSFTLILSVDYLMKIANFLTIPQEESPQYVAPQKTASKTGAKSTISAATSELEERETQITLNFKVEKPDIVLVEHMDSLDTQALILNVSFKFSDFENFNL